MFSSIFSMPAVPYADPWCFGLDERLRMLWRSKCRVAYFYDQANNSTFRYRAYNMVQAINAGMNDVSASYFFRDDLHRLAEIAEAADMLVVCRSLYDYQLSRLIAAFRHRRKLVLFDIDDLVFDIDFVPLIMNTLGQDPENQKTWDYWFAYTSRIGMALKQCDAVLTTNAFLADQIQKFSGLPVAVVPNFINKEQFNFSSRIYAAKAALAPGEDGMIHFGYFSGSPSHNRDFALAIPALECLLEKHKDVGLVIVGYIEAGPQLKRFQSRIRYYPFHDYVNLQRLIASVEFNLIPLQYNTFTNCKSELKYFEAAIAGTLSIASPSYTYANAICDGDTGYFAEACSWEKVMRTAIDCLGDYREMAERAYRNACEKYAWFNQCECILAALGLSKYAE
jgi:glycosyltransferase involved in cell wall biosynthesis